MGGRNGGCEIVHKISEQAGLSISGVYKILNGSDSFSSEKRELVYQLAGRYGYFSGGNSQGKRGGSLKIGVLIPKYPAYFWERAVQGMKDAAGELNSIKLNFYYYPNACKEEEMLRLIELLILSECDAYIIYPLPALDWREFAPQLSAQGRLIFFNDMQENIEKEAFIAYVGPEHFEEGATCAYLAAQKIAEMKEICVLASDGNSEKYLLGRRISGFIKTAKAVNPDINIKQIVLELNHKLAASELAGCLKNHYRAKALDCIYVSSGFLYVACMAADKLNRTAGSPCLNTICLGHEHSVSDERYSGGRIYAYVAQDVYMQGYHAVQEIVTAVMEDRPVKSRYFNSVPVLAAVK